MLQNPAALSGMEDAPARWPLGMTWKAGPVSPALSARHCRELFLLPDHSSPWAAFDSRLPLSYLAAGIIHLCGVVP